MFTGNIIRVNSFGFVYLIFLIETSSCLNLGLISGDLKRSSSPLFIKKSSHHSPITINIRSGIQKPPILLPPILPPILPLKTPPIKTKIKKAKLIKLPKVPILPKLPKVSKLPKLLKVPKLPKLPLLPILPPILPPLIPIIPILPPLLPPILPSLTKLTKPIRVPILGGTKLQKSFGSDSKLLKLPLTKTKLNKNILEKLTKLKKDGSLTTSQFIRFKKLLL